MNFKRALEGSEPSDRVPKRRLGTYSSLLRNANSFPEDFENRMEAWLRGVLREELPRILPIFMGQSSRILNNPIQNNGREADLTLQFITNIPETVFTGNKILGEGKSRVLIELIDSRTGSRVTTGPLSSLKIDIVALKGDFDPDTSNFNEKIVVERQGRRPILNGDLTVTLTQGLGCLENVVLTDNSRWSPLGKFLLGARVSSKSRVGESVREASSNAFKVKDNRGLVYEKHRPPHPNDEVWRLDRIAKDGKYCERLAHKGIHTVKDLLRSQEINPSVLKKILGGKGIKISDRIWEYILGHAADCKIDENEMFTYSSPGLPNIELLFDQVYRLKGATFDGCEYCPVEKLTVHQTNLVQNLKQQAFENLNRLTPVKGSAVGPPRELANLAADRFLVQQDISETLRFGSTSTLTFCYEAPGSHLSEVSVPQFYQPDDVLPPTVIGNFTSVDNTCARRLHGANNFGLSTSSADQNVPQFHVSTNFPSSPSLMPDSFNELLFDEHGNFTSFASNYPFCIGPSDEAGPSYSTTRSRVAWLKIRAAYKWGSVRRNIAAKRNLAATGQQVACL